VTKYVDLEVIDPASPAARVDWEALLERVMQLVYEVSQIID
jgi:hypothetical protein